MAGGPQEIIARPLTLYVAAAGTAKPAFGSAPGVGWTKVGTSGTRSYTEDGVTVSHPQSISEWRAAGSTGPIKAFRTEEGCIVTVTVADLNPAQLALALNGNDVTSAAGVKSIGLSRGLAVTEYALCARGQSPEDNDLEAQYYILRCYVGGEPELVYQKGEPVAHALEFMALEDPDASSEDERFGVLEIQAAET